MRQASGPDSTRPDAVRTGLVGRGILGSRSPWLHEREAQALGLPLSYTLFDFSERGWGDDHLEQLLSTLQDEGFAGVNVTYPFKQMVVPLLDDLSEGARAIGAVNTVAFSGGRRTGYNTDVTGFAAGFCLGLPGVAPGIVLQIGCGGAGSATAQALLGMLDAEKILLHDKDPARAGRLAAQLAAEHGSERIEVCTDPADGAARADGLLNATPVGMVKYPGLPLPADLIEARHWVGDVVYFPLETEFLHEAASRGCRTLDGSGMAVHQAAEAFEIFTGRKVDTRRMEQSFVDFAMAEHGGS